MKAIGEFSTASGYAKLRLLPIVTVMISKINWRQRLLFFSVPAVVLVADQVTKALVKANMTLGQSIPPEGMLRLTYITNPYGVFGLPVSPTFLVISTGIIVILGIWLYFHYFSMESRLLQVGLGLVLGGAVGNMIDRIWFGVTTNFIDVGLWRGFPWERWPTFNIADVSLTVGIFILISCLLVMARRAEE